MIKVFDNFLTSDLASEILRYSKEHCKKNTWGISNFNYNPRLIESSAPIFSMKMHDSINKKIKRLYTDKFKEFKNKQFLIEYKVYAPLSYITWHDDDRYLAGSTIYLSKDYYKNDGGLFLYKDKNNVIKGLEPKFRSMVLNYKDKNEHCVTMVVPGPRFLRETIQLFVEE